MLESSKHSRDLYKVVSFDCRNNRPRFDSSVLWKAGYKTEALRAVRLSEYLWGSRGLGSMAHSHCMRENIPYCFYRRPPTVPANWEEECQRESLGEEVKPMLPTAILLFACSRADPPVSSLSGEATEDKRVENAPSCNHSTTKRGNFEWFQRFCSFSFRPAFSWVFDLVKIEEIHTTFYFHTPSLSPFVEHPTPRRLELNLVALVIYGIRCDRTHFRSARADIGACPSVCMGRCVE